MCEDHPRSQITRDNFVDIQRAIGRLVDELPEEGFNPLRVVDSYWAKGAAILVCHNDSTKVWLTSSVPTIDAWAGFRLKIVGLNALLTYKSVVAWFPGPAEDTERYFCGFVCLTGGLDTRHWKVYDRKDEPNGGRIVFSIDTAFITVLEGL